MAAVEFTNTETDYMANFIHIGERSKEDGAFKVLGYQEITEEVIDEIVQDNRIKWIQIYNKLSDRAYREIDRIFVRRPDLYFRMFGIGTYGIMKSLDLSVLSQMPHVSKLRLDGDFTENKEAVNLDYLCELSNLKGLHLTLFDRLDYGFIKHLAPGLEELTLYADTKGRSIQFDCNWLTGYQKLHTLFLGKRAKKHIESISRIKSLQSLSLSGIKVENFSFLKELSLDSFSLAWCGNSDLAALGELSSLRSLELWRIMKLDDLDFIKFLVNLESLKLKDLKHITTFPDFSRLTKLKDIRIDNVPIALETLDESVRKLVHS